MSKKYTKVHAIRGHVLRVLRFLANWCGDRLMMYKLRDGSKFVLYPGNNLSELVYIGRDYEPVESKFFRDFLKEGDTVLDVGANIGFYSALFSRKVGSTGKVMSFEPGYQTFALLCRTIKALNLKNVTPYPFALWNKMEILVFSNSTSGFDAQQSVGNREEYGTTSVRIPISRGRPWRSGAPDRGAGSPGWPPPPW